MGTQFTWNILSENEYKNQRWEFIRMHEGVEMNAYIDTNEENIPTIGVGFNLNVSSIFDTVINTILYGGVLPAATVRVVYE